MLLRRRVRPVRGEELEGAAPEEEAACARFGVWVDAETCTVRVDNGTLSPADLRALAERYGTALSIETTGGAFRLLPSAGR